MLASAVGVPAAVQRRTGAPAGGVVTLIVMVAAVAVVGWFAAGSVWNVRRGRQLMRWMQAGLPLLGERTTVRWLGTTVVELVIRDAKPPFARVALLLVLEPRDVPWAWALSRRAGRRDTLIVRGVLRRPPARELEAVDPASWAGRDAARSLGRDAWSVRPPASPGALPVHFQDPAALPRADALLGRAAESHLSLRRLSVRRGEPHLQLHLVPPDATQGAREFFQAVRALGEGASA